MILYGMRKGAPSGVLVVVLLALLMGCVGERGTTVIIENRTDIPIIFDYKHVSLAYSGPVTPTTGVLNPRFLSPGNTERYVTLIDPERPYGEREKYVLLALNEAREVVFQRTFTWDELNEMGWKVTIESQVQS